MKKNLSNETITFSSISWTNNLQLECLVFTPLNIKLTCDIFYTLEEVLLDFIKNYKNNDEVLLDFVENYKIDNDDEIIDLMVDYNLKSYDNNSNEIVEFAKKIINNETTKVPELFINQSEEFEDFSVTLNVISGKYIWDFEKEQNVFITETTFKREIIIKDFIEHPYILIKLSGGLYDCIWATKRNIYNDIIKNRLFYINSDDGFDLYDTFDEFFNELSIINISEKFYKEYIRIFGEKQGVIDIEKVFDFFTYKKFNE